MSNRRHILALFIMSYIISACGTQPAPTPTPTEAPPVVTLTASGSGSVTAVLSAVAGAFEAANPGYVLEVLSGTDTGGGVNGTIEGTLDVAAMSRAPRESETEQGIEYVDFGTTYTAVITHPGVGVTELTGEQFKAIVTGEITNWSEVGGSDLEIVVYVRDPEEGNTTDIRETYIGDTPFASSAQIMTSQTDMQTVVSSMEGAIGYGTWATVLASGAEVVPVTVDGIGVDNAPDTLVVTLGIGYLAERASDVQPLADWLLSEEGRNALEAIGVAPTDEAAS